MRLNVGFHDEKTVTQPTNNLPLELLTISDLISEYGSQQVGVLLKLLLVLLPEVGR